MDRIRAFYADKHGVRPERISTPRLREEARQDPSTPVDLDLPATPATPATPAPTPDPDPPTAP